MNLDTAVSPPAAPARPAWARRPVWLAAAGAAFVLGLATVLFFALAPRQAVLFADLRERDLAWMGEELRKKKIPFDVGEDGRSLWVAQADVHRIRMQLMAQDVALQGNVGFELFNGSDLGMTEFVQKVNYQRALQGELARTIQAMDEVQSARVHLALPEQGLFRKAQVRNKASVTVTLKPQARFSRAQVAGVQRLVAASVPDIAPADVAVLDQRGVVLGGTGSSEEDSLDDSWFDRKRSAEHYLAGKAAQVLDRMFGAGASLVSVDVQLNEERRSATIEEVLPGRGGSADAGPAGVLVRERQTTRGAAAREPGGDTAGGAGRTGGHEAASFEYDYQVGRRVEQVHTPAGGVRRMSVAVVLKAALSEPDAARVRDVVAAAVGADRQRGDSVAVTSLQRAMEEAGPALQRPAGAQGLSAVRDAGVLHATPAQDGAAGRSPGAWQGPPWRPGAGDADGTVVDDASPAPHQPAFRWRAPSPAEAGPAGDGGAASTAWDRWVSAGWAALAGAVLALAVAVAGWLRLRPAGAPAGLDARDRAAVLHSVRGWLAEGALANEGQERTARGGAA
jgi:flagellar M-ring protein FliF